MYDQFPVLEKVAKPGTHIVDLSGIFKDILVFGLRTGINKIALLIIVGYLYGGGATESDVLISTINHGCELWIAVFKPASVHDGRDDV